jgi:hypothetical protein
MKSRTRVWVVMFYLYKRKVKESKLRRAKSMAGEAGQYDDARHAHHSPLLSMPMEAWGLPRGSPSSFPPPFWVLLLESVAETSLGCCLVARPLHTPAFL